MGTFVTDPSHPRAAQAAGLALALMRAAKASSWQELTGDPGRWTGLELDAEQVDLLNENGGLLTVLRLGDATVTVAVCPTCGRFSLVADTPPSTCSMTVGCAGKPVKATFARRPAKKAGGRTATSDPAPAAEQAQATLELDVEPGDTYGEW